MKKVLLVMLDGAADPNVRDSALVKARKPYLDKFCKDGLSGLILNDLEEHPDSGISQFVLMGYDKVDYPGRGLFDAFRVIEPKKGEIYIRANFATVKTEEHKGTMVKGHHPTNFIIKDRRAGRDETGLDELVKKVDNMTIDGVRIRVYKSVGHRVVIVLSGKGLSTNVTDADPEEESVPINYVKPTDKSNEAAHTAKVINDFMLKSHEIFEKDAVNKKRKVKANFLLMRGLGQWTNLKSFKDTYGLKGAVVAGSPVTKGIGKVLGMDIIEVKGATAKPNTNLKNKLNAALFALNNHDFVWLHILGADVLSHDKDLNGKVKFIEKIDAEIFSKLDSLGFSKLVLVVVPDHPTSVRTGMHQKGRMPFLVYTKGIKATKAQRFDEESCKLGPLLSPDELMEELESFI